MKTQKKLNLFCTFLLMLAIGKSYSQFTQGHLSDNYAGVTVTTTNTGNDCQDFNGNTYRVSVYTDASCNSYHGIAWNVDIGANNYQSNAMYNQCDTILHADVCLVTDNTDVYALVASFIGGSYNLYCLNMFLWDQNGGSGPGFYLDPNHYLQSGTFGTTVNIDGNDNGQFAFVYDDNNPYSYIVAGYCSSQAVTMYNSGTPIQVQCSTVTARSPDVSLFKNVGYNRAYITYIDNGNGNLVVEDHDMTDLIAGRCTTATSPPSGRLLDRGVPTTGLNCAGCVYSMPRIATPNGSGGTVGDYTVVAETADHSTKFFIVGFNDNNIGSPIIYNNKSLGNGPADLEMANNLGPVVAYDSNYPSDGIWVGWNFDNLGPTYTTGAPYYYSNVVTALYPIVIACDNAGIPLTGYNYWIVPYCSTLTTNDAVQFLSLSGRYATDGLWATYYNPNSSNDICTKEILPSSSVSFRIAGDINTEQLFYEMLHSDPYKVFALKVYDLTGQIILNKAGTGNMIVDLLRTKTNSLPASVFLALVISDDGKFNHSVKFFTAQ